jgi:hypothetical protein
LGRAIIPSITTDSWSTPGIIILRPTAVVQHSVLSSNLNQAAFVPEYIASVVQTKRNDLAKLVVVISLPPTGSVQLRFLSWDGDPVVSSLLREE